MQKTKGFNFSSILSIFKCAIIGVLSTLIGILIFSVVLKFADLPSNIISYVNSTIKIMSIFVMIVCLKKSSENQVFLRGLIAGLFYAILTFIIYSFLNGGFVFDASLVYDIVFAVIVSAIVSVVVNVLRRKSV